MRSPSVFASASVSFAGRWRSAAVAALLPLLLAGCGREAGPPSPEVPQGLRLSPVAFTELPGWSEDRVVEALPALRRSCSRLSSRPDPQAWVGPGALGGTVQDWRDLCGELARAMPVTLTDDPITFRAFLEERFQPYAAFDAEKGESGTFTGYYEAELPGCRTPTPTCQVPLYGVPTDMLTIPMGGQYADMKSVKLTGRAEGDFVQPYYTRAEIEDGALEGRAEVIAWVEDPVDAHILHIQGSGRVQLPDGGVLRVGYAGNNGLPFKGLGRIMLDKGLLEPGQATMPAIRSWLKAHPVEAREIMRENTRYIFFRTIGEDGPIGAQGVPLEPMRSLAVDTRYVALGTPIWLDSVDPDGLPLRRLMMAQDVGSAIKGVVRGDFFWGPGEGALAMAGRMKSPGRWFLLLPKSRRPDAAVTG